VLTRVLYSSDVHSSETVFMKFLNAAKTYQVSALIMGGDLTGKIIVPIIKGADGTYTAKLLGTQVTARSPEEVTKLEASIRYNGFYPYHTDAKGVEELNLDKAKLDSLFDQLMKEMMERWVRIAGERLKDVDCKAYIMPGNDDPKWLGDLIGSSSKVINPEGQVVQLDASHEMVSCGFSNPTPWNSPRELPEEKLAEMLDNMTSKVSRMSTAVFNFHCPPYNCGLDEAPQLDKDLKPVVKAGSGIQMIPVGSTAIRTCIEKNQPMMALHGHIHESRGETRIGRTTCFNPGSEYSEGTLRGLLVNFDEKGIKNRLFVSG